MKRLRYVLAAFVLLLLMAAGFSEAMTYLPAFRNTITITQEKQTYARKKKNKNKESKTASASDTVKVE